MGTRREKLEGLLAEDPQDQFLRYGLALELDKEGESDAGLKMLQGLMQDDPPHVAAHFMSGQILARLDRIDAAREVLRRGIDVARQQGDSHAAGEMSEFLADLGSVSG